MRERTDIYELLLLKFTKELDKEKEAQLDALIEKDPEVAEVWKNLQDFFQKDEQRRKDFENMSAAEIMQGVIERREYIKPRPFPFKKLLIAAILLGAGAFGIYLVSKTNHNSKVLTDSHKQIPPKSVYLQLENGEIFDLSGKETHYSTENGEVTLNNSRNKLTFSADRNNIGLNKLVVPPGKEYSIRLADGTEIRMNAGSTLQFPFGFNRNSREITFTGEAYIQVASVAKQPFTVHTPAATIQVLGTEFNINTYTADNAAVSLVDGAVKVLAGKQEVLLKPGLQAEYTTQKGINTRPFDKNDVLSWLEGKYTFNKTPLRDIIPILERWYDVTIIPDNPDVADKTFNGQITKSEGIGSFLEMLKVIRVADYYYTNDTIHIK
ncbi:FecR family protein [Chitinophaga rhizophila]|uniref:FecR domain-containing protein n=1 Tax=Chitinophaga rhizophila TaxID=2866212 RepID=A0ABS7GB29_9BACT|nr:FecR domain-containing protein [Chitinophaga rhizophila]MBW8683743.1 FecR domain-containing protein [Chitinophaga rhizophila]